MSMADPTAVLLVPYRVSSTPGIHCLTSEFKVETNETTDLMTFLIDKKYI